MARLARVIAQDAPHHVTQRGNGRQIVFASDADRLVYLDLLHRHCALHRLSLAGYCLMSNHVHLIVIPARAESLPLALKHAHGRYAAYFNARYASSGHVWQGRYYSCPLDESHFWAALRYTELNPVRAGLAATPMAYPWSSAAAHCGIRPNAALDMGAWDRRWTPATWQEYLAAVETAAEMSRIRRNTHNGRPLGSADFVEHLEKVLHRRLAPQKGGRPRTAEEPVDQQVFRYGQP